MLKATNLESPEMASVVLGAAPNGFPAAVGGSPIGNRCSVAPLAVCLTTTVASPSLGARTYANHFPSLEITGDRIDFHALRSAGVSCFDPATRELAAGVEGACGG